MGKVIDEQREEGGKLPVREIAALRSQVADHHSRDAKLKYEEIDRWCSSSWDVRHVIC